MGGKSILHFLSANGTLILMFLWAFLVSLWLTPYAARLSRRLGAIDHPDERKVHARPIPRLGGLGMAMSLIAAMLLFLPIEKGMIAFLLGALIVSGAGCVDDIRPLRPPVKFAFQVLAAGSFTLISSVSLDNFGNLFGFGDIRTGALAPYLTVFCMTGVMNALNLSDGLDGLAGGISSIACVFLGIFAYLHNDVLSLSILVVLLGSTLGFLRYNFHPAALFMGDTGSLLLGYSLSTACVILAQKPSAGIPVAPITVAAVLALPILDTLMVMFGRLCSGSNPFLPDKTHLHHRLLDMGFPHAVVVPILYISMGSFGLLSMGMSRLSEGRQLLAVLILAGAIYGMVYYLELRGYRLEMSNPGKDDALKSGLADALPAPNRDTAT